MKKVLLVDDEPNVLDLLAATLGTDPRYRLLLARDGEEALEIAQREEPDLIFLDVMMPKRDGYEVCRVLKTDPVTAHAWVVMVTARVQEADKQQGANAGADDYFTKPFSPTALLRKVDEVFSQA